MNADTIAARFGMIDGIGFIVEAWKGSCDASHALDLLRRYLGTLQSQFNATPNAFFKFEKRRLERAQPEHNLNEKWGGPYQAPVFETHLESDAPPPLPLIHLKNPKPAPAPPPIVPQRNEPTAAQPVKPANKLWSPPKPFAA